MLDAGPSFASQRKPTSVINTNDSNGNANWASHCDDYTYDYYQTATDTGSDTTTTAEAETETDKMGLSTLPYDLLLNIATYLDLRDVHALHLTCKSLYDASTTRPVYRKLATDLLRRCRALPLKGFQRLADLNTEALILAVNKATHYETAWRVRAPRPIGREGWDERTGVNRRSNYMDVAPRGVGVGVGKRDGDGRVKVSSSSSSAQQQQQHFKWYKIVSAPPGEEVDWLSPITSSYTLCATKSGKVVCWDVQSNTCLAEWNPGARWELWKCRVEFEERTVFFTMAKVLAGSRYDDERIMQFVLMRLTFSDPPSGLSAPPSLPPVFSHVTEFRTSGVVMNVFLLDPAERLLSAFIWVSNSNTIGLYALPDWEKREYVFVDTGIECVMSSNWSCILYQNHIVIHCEESDAAYQHFYPLALLETYITVLAPPLSGGEGEQPPVPVISRRLPPVRTLKKRFVFPLLRGPEPRDVEEDQQEESEDEEDEDRQRRGRVDKGLGMGHGAGGDPEDPDLDLDLDLEAEMQSTIHEAYLVHSDEGDADGDGEDSFMTNANTDSNRNDNGSSSSSGGGIRILNGDIHDPEPVAGPSNYSNSYSSPSSSASSSSLLSLSQVSHPHTHPPSSASSRISSSPASSSQTTLPPAGQVQPPPILTPIPASLPSLPPAPPPLPTPTPTPNPFPFPTWYPESAHFVRQWWPSLPSIPRVSCTVVLLAAHDQTTHRTRFVLAQHYFRVPLGRREWEGEGGDFGGVSAGGVVGGGGGGVNGMVPEINADGMGMGGKALTNGINGHVPYINGAGSGSYTTASTDADAQDDAQDDALMNLWYVSKPFEVVRVFDSPSAGEDTDVDVDADADAEGADGGADADADAAGAGASNDGDGNGADTPADGADGGADTGAEAASGEGEQAQAQDDDDVAVTERPRPLVAVDFGHAVWIEYVDSGDLDGDRDGEGDGGQGRGWGRGRCRGGGGGGEAGGEGAADGGGDGDGEGEADADAMLMRMQSREMGMKPKSRRHRHASSAREPSGGSAYNHDGDKHNHHHNHHNESPGSDERSDSGSDSDSDMHPEPDPDAKWLRFVTFPAYSEDLGMEGGALESDYEDGEGEGEGGGYGYGYDFNAHGTPPSSKGKGKGKGKSKSKSAADAKSTGKNGNGKGDRKGKGKAKQHHPNRSGRRKRRETEGVVRTLATPPGLDLSTVETINIDQSQGAVILSDKAGRIWILCYE
ncbi:hypothetical protein GALMADRAFT_282524 [Galerina marginata CBS 339.88]|uniref:F-box domain-containing protein n=1 Tax=Galerina marginata (strain CBS 339.88) TaxID=685588 RepID=A0A067SQ62_GALM3|nr:hypothetical protein GALMADRAFT_282524 [Galerina marginata CBS 339.88]